MQILINLIVFLIGFGIGYLYGYYIRSRRAIHTLNESIERTIKEQQQLREQYAQLRNTINEIKMRPTLAYIYRKNKKLCR